MPQPRAHQHYTLELNGTLYEGETDDDGMIDIYIPPGSQSGRLTIGPDGMIIPIQLGTLDPGFTLATNEKIRIVTGNSGRKAHGPAPAESNDLKNYHLFLDEPILKGPGTIVALSLKQHEIARGVYDPASPTGVPQE